MSRPESDADRAWRLRAEKRIRDLAVPPPAPSRQGSDMSYLDWLGVDQTELGPDEPEHEAAPEQPPVEPEQRAAEPKAAKPKAPVKRKRRSAEPESKGQAESELIDI